MGLYRRKDVSNPKVWYMRYTDAAGKVQRKSTETENKQLAQLALDKVQADIWQQRKLGTPKPHLFAEAVEKFVTAKAERKSLRDYERQLDWWKVQLDGLFVHQITQEIITEKIEAKRKADGISNATMNRYLAALRACLRLVMEKYRWINPAQLPAFFMEEEPKGRTRWLKPDEVKRLIDALPDHWKDIAGFALATGQRMGNVLQLRWEQINLESKTVLFDGDEMKNGEDHGIALNDVAVEIVKRQVGKHDTHVFTYRGKPMKRGGYDTWHAALAKAGIEDFRLHDMRHTWASMMVQAGTSDAVLMALGSWKTPKMVRRYAHHSAESLRPFVQAIDGKLSAALSGVTQIQHGTQDSANVVQFKQSANSLI